MPIIGSLETVLNAQKVFEERGHKQFYFIRKIEKQIIPDNPEASWL